MRNISRRELLQRLGAAGLVLGGAAALGRWRYDRGLVGVAANRERPQTRDHRVHDGAEQPALAIAKNESEPEALVRKAILALGGMQRFVSRGDIVVVKPNIGWDRT